MRQTAPSGCRAWVWVWVAVPALTKPKSKPNPNPFGQLNASCVLSMFVCERTATDGEGGGTPQAAAANAKDKVFCTRLAV